MTTSQNQCNICGTCAKCQTLPASDIGSVECPKCDKYFFFTMEVGMDDDALFGAPSDRGKVSALLFERTKLTPKALPPAFVLDIESARNAFGNENRRPYAFPVRASELLATWPKSVPEQLDRAILLIARLAPNAGDVVKLNVQTPVLDPWCCLAVDDQQAEYIQKHLRDLGLLDVVVLAKGAGHVELTPRGWERVAELARSADENDVFVAMWFGEARKHDKEPEDRTKEMRRLYDEAIYPAITGAGYRGHRADSGDYNGEIMDKVRYDIRRAPFVVADFTNHNHGVYFEAGLASGNGIDVIHCCPATEFEKAHFDIRHVNHIVYESLEDLRKQLKRRILRSRGEGPFPPPGGVTWD